MGNSMVRKMEPNRFLSWARIGQIAILLIVTGGTGNLCANPLQEPERGLGKRIYSEKCASCHGDKGQGTSEYLPSLEGGLSAAQLRAYIHETMPEDEPGTLSQRESAAVSSYVYDAFYSTIAQARNRPARIELSRLTVNQYQQSITDLISGFIGSSKPDGREGLKGRYVEGRKLWNKKAKQQIRVDSEINFNFGNQPPIKSIGEGKAYTIMWTGSLFAPETGKYRLILSSPDAVRLWLNDKTTLIDAWVKSADKDDSSADIFLVGGRYYPIVVEYAKATQGVVRKVKKEKPRDGKIVLRWRRPHGVLGVIPGRYFTPVKVAPSYLCDVPFPPDDNSYGWTRSSNISKEWDRATTLAAVHAANFVSERLDVLAKTKPQGTNRLQNIKQFCKSFVARAFRGRIDQSIEKLVEGQFENSGLGIKTR